MEAKQDQNVAKIPFIAHEAEIHRTEKRVRRWQSAFLTTFVLLIITNCGCVMCKKNNRKYHNPE